MTRKNKNGTKISVESDPHFSLCKDFLCPPETRIREWFPSLLDARLRCRTLDPYGLMIEVSKWKQCQAIYSNCCDENCHARIVLKSVDPDPEGNIFGVFGCISHQHPLPRKKVRMQVKHLLE